MARGNNRDWDQHLFEQMLLAQIVSCCRLRQRDNCFPIELKEPFARREEDARSRFQARVGIELHLSVARLLLRIHFGDSGGISLGLFRLGIFCRFPIHQRRRHFFPLRTVEAVVADPVAIQAIFADKLETAVLQYELLAARQSWGIRLR